MVQPYGGNVGIGTSSPAYKLDVAGAISTNNNLTFTGTGNRITGDFSNATVGNRVGFQSSTVNGQTALLALPNGTSAQTQIQILNSSDSANASIGQILINATEMRFHPTLAGTGTYLPMTFYTGGSERARIDTSGNVGIGLTSYNLKLSVAADANGQNIQINGRTGDDFGQIFFRNFGGANNLARIASDSSAGLSFGTGSQTAPTVPTERMRIDSSGNVGIGITPVLSLDVAGRGRFLQNVAASSGAIVLRQSSGDTEGAFIQWVNNSNASEKGWLTVDTSSNMKFATVSTERMRIDSSGNLLVGTTGQIGIEKLGVEQSSATGQSAYFYNSNASYTGNVININTARAANTAFTLLNAYSAGVSQVAIGGTGLIYSVQLAGGATTLSVNASGQIIRTPSDASLKTNIQPITYGLDTVMKLKPIKHEWVEEINMGAPSIGFIAQDMELEVPEVVSGEEYKSIDYPKLTAVLTKAIQEQQALIQSLTARITALESN